MGWTAQLAQREAQEPGAPKAREALKISLQGGRRTRGSSVAISLYLGAFQRVRAGVKRVTPLSTSQGAMVVPALHSAGASISFARGVEAAQVI